MKINEITRLLEIHLEAKEFEADNIERKNQERENKRKRYRK